MYHLGVGTYLQSNAFARLDVAINVANALCELHYNCQYPIFHRDVKSSNVLLDSDYHAKLSDLGLAVIIKQESDLKTPVALGAFGYKDPIYEQTGQLNDKTDVYSFGVLLMELATHLPAWDTKRPVTLLSHIVLERMKRGKIEQIIQPGRHLAVTSCNISRGLQMRLNRRLHYLEAKQLPLRIKRISTIPSFFSNNNEYIINIQVVI
jgi:serine/threonine protein kinase